MNNNGLSYIDLFAGAGGLSEGFIQSGYQPIAHVEMNEYAARTIETRIAYYYLKEKGQLKDYYEYEKGLITRETLLNLIPEEELKTVINKEVSEKTIKSIFETIDSIKIEKGIEKVDVIIGGPPCQAQVGTIHGFHGDECDIIFAVFNTPPTISSGKDMFLNKRNIVNVAISRAKDYLFVIMPDDDTENINNLRLVKRVEQLFKSSQAYVEYQSQDLERQMFDCNTYLEDNAFSTGHQSVNVYGLPEKKYEIRSEDSAVDIQIHN